MGLNPGSITVQPYLISSCLSFLLCKSGNKSIHEAVVRMKGKSAGRDLRIETGAQYKQRRHTCLDHSAYFFNFLSYCLFHVIPLKFTEVRVLNKVMNQWISWLGTQFWCNPGWLWLDHNASKQRLAKKIYIFLVKTIPKSTGQLFREKENKLWHSDKNDKCVWVWPQEQ